MQKITAVIRAEKLDDVRAALRQKGYPGLMLTRIEGHGTQKGISRQFRGRAYTVDLLPKMKLEIVVNASEVQPLIEAIAGAARTGEVGDGKIFVSPVTQVYRIRTGDLNESAL